MGLGLHLISIHLSVLFIIFRITTKVICVPKLLGRLFGLARREGIDLVNVYQVNPEKEEEHKDIKNSKSKEDLITGRKT